MGLRIQAGGFGTSGTSRENQDAEPGDLIERHRIQFGGAHFSIGGPVAGQNGLQVADFRRPSSTSVEQPVEDSGAKCRSVPGEHFPHCHKP